MDLIAELVKRDGRIIELELALDAIKVHAYGGELDQDETMAVWELANKALRGASIYRAAEQKKG